MVSKSRQHNHFESCYLTLGHFSHYWPQKTLSSSKDVIQIHVSQSLKKIRIISTTIMDQFMVDRGS